MKLAVVGVAALFASATNADASAREIRESSYGFADSLWTQTDIERSGALSPSSRGGSHQCSANCGPAFGTTVVRRSDLLTSNTADLAARTTADANGHAMGVGGAIVVERLEPDASGSADELDCRLGARFGREWIAFVVPALRRSNGRALAPG
jgi:hypothetical protein